MKKSAMRIFVALISVVFIAVQPAFADSSSDELERVRARVSTMFDQIDPKNVEPSPIDGWYTVRKGAIIAYMSGDGRYLLQGDLIDLENQVNLSETERNKARLEMVSSVPDDEKIIFTPDVVKYSINVFTDIDCTYCRKLHSQIDEYLARGIEVKYLLYPRNGPTSPSWAKAERVWCADDRHEAITLAKLDQPFETSDCDASIVGRNYALGRDVGLTGTPAIVLPDGAMLSGYLPPESLEARLALVEKPALAKN